MALVYFDTSVVLSLHILDANTEKLTEVSTKLTSAYAISAWTRTEIASALGIMVRRKDLSALDAHAAFSDMQAFCSNAHNLPVTSAAYELATRWMQDFDLGLRAGDALHGAICKLNKAQLFTADHGLVKAMQRLGQKPLLYDST